MSRAIILIAMLMAFMPLQGCQTAAVSTTQVESSPRTLVPADPSKGVHLSGDQVMAATEASREAYQNCIVDGAYSLRRKTSMKIEPLVDAAIEACSAQVQQAMDDMVKHGIAPAAARKILDDAKRFARAVLITKLA